MVENRYVLYGLIAGAASGVVAASITAYLVVTGGLTSMISDLIRAQGGSPSLLPADLMSGLNSLVLLSLVAVILQYVILGALFALIESYLVGKGVKPAPASLVAGAAFVAVVALPLSLARYFLSPATLEVILKYLPPHLLILPAITYLVVLTILSSFRGPWEKWGSGGPSMC